MRRRMAARYLVLLFFCFYFDWAQSVKLLELKVPALVDPRENVTLGCRFDMGSHELNSVKWYKDDNEFFRYTPRTQQNYRSFPVPGVHLGPSAYGDCDLTHCIVHLTQLTTLHSSGSYRCEVSTEAPTFHVAFESANLTVAALGRHDPLVEGLHPSYSIADLVFGNCTSAPADPAPRLTWSINGRPAPSVAVGQPITSKPDTFNLVTRTLLLRFYAEKHHFSQPGSVMELKCEASTPGIPAPSRTTIVTAALRDSQHNSLSNQQLAWPGSTGAKVKIHFGMITFATMLLKQLDYFY